MLKKVLFFMLIFTSLGKCGVNALDLGEKSQVLERITTYEFEKARDSGGIWLLATVKLDDPTSYNPVEPKEKTEGNIFLVKRGKLIVQHNILGKWEASPIDFVERTPAYRKGNSFTQPVLFTNHYEDYFESNNVLIQVINRGEDRVSSLIPIPIEWNDEAVKFFGNDKAPANPFNIITVFKHKISENENDQISDILVGSVKSDNYWQAASIVKIFIEKSKIENLERHMDLLKSLYKTRNIGNIDGFVFGLYCARKKALLDRPQKSMLFLSQIQSLAALIKKNEFVTPYNKATVQMLTNMVPRENQ